MQKNIFLITALGLILASALLPTANARAYPTCPSGAGQSCSCCSNTPSLQHTLPFYVYNAPNCAGPYVKVTTLPTAGEIGNTLPGLATAASTLTTQCTSGTVCDPNTGLCCTPNCSACSTSNYSDGCGGTCSANCTGTGACCTGSGTCSTFDVCGVCGGNGSSCTYSSTYTTAPCEGYEGPGVGILPCSENWWWVTYSNYQNYQWCDSAGNITKVDDSYNSCAGTNTASLSCKPIFTTTNTSPSLSSPSCSSNANNQICGTLPNCFDPAVNGWCDCAGHVDDCNGNCGGSCYWYSTSYGTYCVCP